MILAVYYIVCLIHIAFWITFVYFLKKSSISGSETRSSFPGVSIIVCFKNEASNLPSLVQFLTTQDYPEYEIILVNDHSNDTSTQVIAACEDDRILLIHLPDSAHGKKQAQEYGIQSAKHEIILVTDADCTGSSSWIKSMLKALNDKEICLGYAPLSYGGSFASQFAAYESWMAGVQYLSYASAGIPYMGVGRNLAFKKSLFLDSGGHSSHHDLLSGDDDLFVNAVANGSNTTLQLNPQSYVWSPSKSTWSNYFNQKSRHLTTSIRYKFKHQVLLSLFAMCQIALYLFPIISLFIDIAESGYFWMAFVITLSLKYLITISIHKYIPYRNLPSLFPLMDMLLTIYYLIMPFIMLFKRKTEWK